MMQQVLSHYHLPGLACFGLALFILVFLGAVVWVYRTGSSKFYEGLSALPLSDELGFGKTLSGVNVPMSGGNQR